MDVIFFIRFYWCKMTPTFVYCVKYVHQDEPESVNISSPGWILLNFTCQGKCLDFSLDSQARSCPAKSHHVTTVLSMPLSKEADNWHTVNLLVHIQGKKKIFKIWPEQEDELHVWRHFLKTQPKYSTHKSLCYNNCMWTHTQTHTHTISATHNHHLHSVSDRKLYFHMNDFCSLDKMAIFWGVFKYVFKIFAVPRVCTGGSSESFW